MAVVYYWKKKKIYPYLLNQCLISSLTKATMMVWLMEFEEQGYIMFCLELFSFYDINPASIVFLLLSFMSVKFNRNTNDS